MNTEAFDAMAALPIAALHERPIAPTGGTLSDVSGAQVAHSDAVVIAAFQADAFSQAFQTGCTQPVLDKGGEPPAQGSTRSLPADGPRTFDDIPFRPGIDGVTDVDELRMKDAEPPPTISHGFTVNDSLVEEVRVDLRADAEVIPGPQRRYTELLARVEALEKLLAAQSAVGIGHNNPPEAIDVARVLPTRPELERIMIVVRGLAPSQKSVPPAQQAHDRLRRFIDRALDACADESGKMGARVGVPVLATAAVLIVVALIEVAHAHLLWIEAVLRSAA